MEGLGDVGRRPPLRPQSLGLIINVNQLANVVFGAAGLAAAICLGVLAGAAVWHIAAYALRP